MITSADFEWKPLAKHEVFSFLNVSFDVNKAKKIIEKAPREIDSIAVNEATGLLGFIRVDRHRLSEIDIGIPVIVAYNSFAKGNMVIDGWHRVARAAQLGVERLPAVVLTREESKKVERKR